MTFGESLKKLRRQVFETLYEGWAYQERLDDVRRHFPAWSTPP